MLSTEHEIPFFLAWGTIWWGWALAAQGQGEEGIAQMLQGLAAEQATGGKNWQPYFLTLLAEAYGEMGQEEEGLTVLTDALAMTDKIGERYWEADLYRLKGELTLQKEFKVQGFKFQVTAPQLPTPNPHPEVEACFLKAMEVACKQQAKSLELRAATSLARLWQQQGKTAEAHKLLADVYNRFTEGFDTKDLQEAKALLDELA
jgi:predicted ATPase